MSDDQVVEALLLHKADEQITIRIINHIPAWGILLPGNCNTVHEVQDNVIMITAGIICRRTTKRMKSFGKGKQYECKCLHS